MLAAQINARPLYLSAMPSRNTFEGVENSFRAPKNTKKVSPARADPFFNRTEEQKTFNNNVLNDEGCFITVLLGPPNCGKSRFLKKLQDDFEAEDDGRLMLYLDGRNPCSKFSTAEQISKTLRNQVMSEDFQRSITRSLTIASARAEVNMGPTNLSAQVPTNFNLEFKGSEEDLDETLVGLMKLFEASRLLPTKPVIVLDEANKLMQWRESDASNPQLETLVDFFILISKQLNLVHVVLATSEYSLARWLTSKGLAEDKFERKVIGDLPENEARDFVFGSADKTWPGIVNNPQRELLPVPACSDKQWHEIYEHCGGNIWLLRQCVKNARGEENWDGALESAVVGAISEVDAAAKPGGLPMHGDTAPRWNGAQWKKVLELITTAPHHAVLKSRLEKELDKDSTISGELILLSMVKYNLLALRYPSVLARDLPQEVYGNDGVERPVVTLLLPSYVWAAKQLLEDEDFVEACEKHRSGGEGMIL